MKNEKSCERMCVSSEKKFGFVKKNKNGGQTTKNKNEEVLLASVGWPGIWFEWSWFEYFVVGEENEKSCEKRGYAERKFSSRWKENGGRWSLSDEGIKLSVFVLW